jgi:hypothetical protein
MTAYKFRRVIVGIASFLALVALPVVASAQSSTFVIPFSRVGPPGTECEAVIDPVTGVMVIDPTTGQPVMQCNPTGAFQNPCTLQNVDVTGSTTMTISLNVTGSGQGKASVSETTKGSGMGWDPTLPYLVGVNPNPLTATIYNFTESQQFNAQFTLNGDPTTLTTSTFTDKLFMKGAKSTDNWTIKATFKIQINGQGVVTSTQSSFTGNVCNG